MSSFEINCTVEGDAPDNVTHECGVSKNLTWTGDGTHSGLSFYLFRNQLTGFKTSSISKTKITKLIKFTFTPLTENFVANVKVRVKYNVDGVLTVLDEYNLGGFTEVTVKYHQLLMDANTKDNTYILLDVITEGQANGQIKVEMDCQPTIISADFCIGFTKESQYCKKCPKTVTYYAEKLSSLSIEGLVINNTNDFNSLLGIPWYSDENLTTEISSVMTTLNFGEINRRTRYVYDQTRHGFFVAGKCDGDVYDCNEPIQVPILLQDYTASTPHLPSNPNAKPNGLKYAIRNVTITGISANSLYLFRVECTDGAEDVSFLITDGVQNDEVGDVSYKEFKTYQESPSEAHPDNFIFKVATPESLVKVRYKLGEGAFIKIGPRNWNTSKKYYAITNSGMLNLRIAVGQNKGFNSTTPVNVVIYADCPSSNVYGYDMGVHPYSQYDAYSNPKFITKVWSAYPISDWYVRGTYSYEGFRKGQPIFTDSLLTTPALPYYYGDSVRPSATNKIYQVGYPIKREYGLQVNYVVTKWLFGPRETNEVIWGPKDFSLHVNADVYNFPDFDATTWYIPANVQPSMVGVGHFTQIIEPTTVRTPTVYSYQLGWSGTTSNEYDANNNTFTSYDFGKEKHTPITGFEHMITRMTRGYMLGSSIPNLRDYMVDNKFAAWGFGGSVAARLALEWWGTNVLYHGATLAFTHVFFWVAAFLLVVAIIAFAIALIVPQQKLFIEKPKYFRRRYSNQPFLNDVDSVIATDINLTNFIPGYYTDGGYTYYLPTNSTTKIPTTRTFGYKYVDGVKTLNQVDLLKDATKREYITDTHKLFFLTYILGRPEKYSTSPPLFLSTPITSLSVVQSSALIGELNNPVSMELNIDEGQFTSEVSQEEADNLAQDYFDSLKVSLEINQLSVERKPGVTNIETYFTHELKLEEEPNSFLMWYDNSNGNGITVGKKLYHDVDGKLSALNGYYRNYKNSNLLFYKIEYGYVTDILSGTTSVTSQVNGGTQSLVQTDLDHTSAWFINSFNPEDLNLSFTNNVDNLITDWNTNQFYTGSTINKGILKNRIEAESFYLYDNNLTSTNYSEAAESTYREVYPFNSVIFSYIKPHTITINSQEICELDEVGLRFNAVDSNGNVSPTYVGITFTVNIYTGSTVLFDTIEVTIGPNDTTSFIPLNIPFNGGTITSVDIVNWVSPNPFNKVTFVEGTYSVSDGVTPCDYYSGLTYQVVSFGFVQYTKYDGTTVFTNKTEGIYDIDDIVEFGSLKGSIDENYTPSANIIILDYDGCITSPRATDVTIDNDSIDEGTPIDTEVATFSTVSNTPEETYIYTLVSGTGSSDNDSFGLTTGGTLSNLITLNYDVKTSYSIRVRSTDPLGGYFEKSFTLTINDVNRAPYGLTLSNLYLPENSPVYSTIGELNGLDYDDNETFTYTLFDDINYPDNYYFNLHTVTDELDISRTYLRNSTTFNYESKTGYTINVKVTDSGNSSFTSTFNISVGDVNEQPSGVFLSNTSVYENLPSGTTVGIITTYDEDVNDTYTYMFANALEIDDDNYLFSIVGNELKTKHAFDYEDRTTYYVVIRATQDVVNGFTATQVFQIDILDVYVNLVASATSDFNGYNIKCPGESNGVITISEVSGNGTAPHTYSKDGINYQSSLIFTGLTAGTYTIYAKESGGEVGSITGVTVTQPDELGFEVTNVTKPTCYNDNNGSFTLVGTGGVSPYTYSLDGTNYTSLGLFQNKSATTHNGYVKDENGCIYGPAPIGNLIVTQPNIDTFVTNVLCYGNFTGVIEPANPRLGNGAPYMTRLLNSEGTVLSGYTTYTESTIYTGLYAGDYYVDVKDVSGCTYSKLTTINQPAQVTVSFSNITKPTCYTGNTGSFRVTASGGSGDLYSYRNGGSGNWTGFSGNYIDFTNKSSATYSIQFKDRNDCVSTVESVDLNVSAPNGTISITGATCYGGSDGRINVSALTGNVGPYSAKLEFGGTTIDDYRPITTNRTYTGLTQGTYLVYFKDGNDCEKSYGAIVTEPDEIVTTLTPTNPTCYSSTNGSIVVSASGGTAPYTYSKDGTTYQADATFNNLANGTYTITTKDSVGCTVNNTIGLDRTEISALITPINLYCFNGNDGRIGISVVTGGQGTYSTKLNANGTYESLSIAKIYSGLSAGSYTVYIKDVADCEKTYSVTLTQPTQLTISGVGTSPTCYDGSDGSVTVTSSGGTGAKTYYISSNGVNYGSPTTGTTFSNLSVGTYSFLVVDANSCTAFSSDVTLSKLAPSATSTITNVSCNGGSDGKIVLSSFTNGSPPYSVSTNEGSTYTIANTSFTYSGLTTGNYRIYIKDSNECTQSYLYSVTQPTSLSVATSGVAPTCYDGSNGTVTASGSGGTGPYEYSINGGSSYQTSTTFSNLTNGSYTITVKDSKGCTANSSTVTLNRTAPSASISSSNPSCFGGTGSIAVSSGSGGSGSGYQVKNGSGGTYENLPVTYSSLGGGTYTIYIKDGSGCVQTYDRTITIPSQVTISISTTSNPSCSYYSDGSIVVTSSGGTGAKTYSKDGTNYQSSGTFAVGNGTYTLYAKDANGCIATTSATVNRPVMNPTLVVDNVSCFGGSNGRVYMSAVSGGAGTLSQWTWQKDGDLTVRPSNYQYADLTPGSYDFTIFDANGCIEYRTITITQPSSAVTATISNVVAASGANNDGQMTIFSQGGTWPKIYYLYKDTESPYNDYPTGTLVATYTGVTASAPNRTLTNLSCGYYWLLVNDANLCSANTLETSVGCSVTPDGYFIAYYNSTPCSYINPINVYYSGVGNAGFQHGDTYYNSGGAPLDGTLYGTPIYYSDGNIYGTINSQGVFSGVGVCA